uniref:Peptidase S1 domain-containing protein n=1 Tax=Dromaius novaehollandiae TaxID=8790 RepID=A0A8C4KGV0_DRONO
PSQQPCSATGTQRAKGQQKLKAALSLAGCGTRRQMTSFSGVERIAGGQLARDGEWPWQASIQLDGIHRCGASVISNTWLLTAAHCFRGGTDPRRWTASFGTLLRPPKQKKFVRNIIIHEEYNDHLHNHEYDVAVVELASPIKFTSDVHSICLPEASHVFPDNASCFVTGWGALRNDGNVNQLRQAEVKIISTRICNMRQVYHGMITPGMLCAGYLEGQVDACQVSLASCNNVSMISFVSVNFPAVLILDTKPESLKRFVLCKGLQYQSPE